MLITDLAVGKVLYDMTLERTSSERKAAVAFGLWFLCPLVIWSSTVACMFDSLSALFTMVMIQLLLKRSYAWSGLAFALAVLTKVFPVALIFLAVMLIVSRERGRLAAGLKGLATFLAGAGAGSLLILAPMIARGEMGYVTLFLTSRSGPLIVDGTLLGYSGVITFFPSFIIILVAYSIALFREKDERRDETFLFLAMVSIATVFCWVCTLTYPVLLIPLLAYFYVKWTKLAIIPWALFSTISVAFGFSNFGYRLFYSVAAYTGLLDLPSMVEASNRSQEMLTFMNQATGILDVVPAVAAVILAIMAYRKFGGVPHEC